MKNYLILVSLIASACGSDAEPADAGPDANVNGTYTLSWTINGGSMEAACDAVGASSVQVVAFEENAALGEVESFGCDDFAGESRGIPAGNYRFELDVRSIDGRSLLPEIVDVFDVEVPVAGSAALEPQAFTIAATGGVTFAVSSEGAADNCAAAGITGMRFNLRDAGGTCVPTTFIVDGGDPDLVFASTCSTETPGPMPCIESNQIVRVAATPSGPHMLEMIGIVGGEPCRVHTAQVTILGNNLDSDLGVRQMADTGCP